LLLRPNHDYHGCQPPGESVRVNSSRSGLIAGPPAAGDAPSAPALPCPALPMRPPPEPPRPGCRAARIMRTPRTVSARRALARCGAAAAVSTQLRSCCCVFGLEYRGSGAMGQGASRAHGSAGGPEKASPVTPSRCLVRSTCRFGARRPPLDSAWSLVSKLFFSPCPRARRDASARESGSVSVRQGRRALKL
jgi:hypothetical protein